MAITHAAATLATFTATRQALKSGRIAEYDGGWAVTRHTILGQPFYTVWKNWTAVDTNGRNQSETSLADTLDWLGAHGVNVNDVTFVTPE